MESLLRGLAESQQHNDALKRALFDRFFSTLSTNVLTSTECCSYFRLFVEWILTTDNPMLINYGHQQLSLLAVKNASVFYEYATPNLVIDLFSNTIHTNKLELVRLASELLRLLKELDPQSRDEHLRSVYNVTRSHVATLLRDQGIHLRIAAEISRLYQSNPQVLPNHPEWTRFTVLVVNLLAAYRLTDDVTSVSLFLSEAEEVSKILPLIWGRSDSPEGISECLNTFYIIVSSEDSFSKPSSAMSCIVTKIPKAFLDCATEKILGESYNQQGEAKTVVGLQNMIEWVTTIPCGPILSQWLLDMLKGLRERSRSSMLIEVAHASTERLANALTNPLLCPAVESLFFFLLLGFQHSESAFHSIVAALPDILTSLRKQGNEDLLQRLGESAHFLVQRFPDFPELYHPVCQTLKALNINPPPEERIRELKSLGWLSPMVTPVLDRKRKSSCTLIDESLWSRSETGMVGLINLGNTCYMNSVLQALFITKDFSDTILSAPLTSCENVLLRLQQTFTYLRHSQRAIFSPAEFLKVARPPWFDVGRQQDCSEFLRYLLDTLHEQEKNGRLKRSVNAATLGQSESSCPVIEQTPTPMEEDEAESQQTPMADEEDTPGKACSSAGLDVIAEAPERAAEDESMSQDSEARGEEDFFGSRGSLSCTTRECSDDECGANMRESAFSDPSDVLSSAVGGLCPNGMGGAANLCGSRTSLGSSNGLKRWTTEDNLSSMDEGSREGKLDLLDGTVMHNSHSDSTDSGIQSVGESIRGSSDSMGRKTLAAEPPPPAVSVSSPEAVAQTASPASEDSGYASVVHSAFGGHMRTTYKCSTCHTESVQREHFTELHLAVPESDQKAKAKSTQESETVTKCENEPQSTSQNSQDTQPVQQPGAPEENQQEASKEAPLESELLTVQTLLANYFKPELLEGDNQYHCDKCAGLQNAMKTIHVVDDPPNHLICTLMRFKYDREAGRKSKVFTEVDYQLHLVLPVLTSDGMAESRENYRLYAIVVHSGYSSDGGHYYTYARDPCEEDRCDGEDGSESTWYIFNDSKVSFSSFGEFKSVCKRFPRDAAYQLFYCRVSDDMTRSASGRRSLRADLRAAVEKDNLRFLREKERLASPYSNSPSNSTWNSNWKRDSDDDGNGSGGGGGGGTLGCGGGGFNSGGGRLVC